MRSSFKQVAKLMTRRSRSGQSIILVAFAFIALIAFVGIATDVALLFVRYSTLRRAVDAAAIAAAGQIRENANYMSLNAVAMQFIQSHGLNPDSVKVETCETDIDAVIKANPGVYNDPATNGKKAYEYLAGINPPIPSNQNPPSELCTKSPQKLVRVSAQVESPTAFLHVIGWRTVTLQTSSLSQTALLDVALVLDTSLSESGDTRVHQAIPAGTYPVSTNPDGSTDNREALRDFKDFTNPSPNSTNINPAKPWGLGGPNSSATYGLKPATATDGSDPGGTGRTIRSECWYTPIENNATTWSNYGYAGCCNDPSTQSDGSPGGVPTATFNKTNPWPAGGPTFNLDPDWYVYDKQGLDEAVIMTDGKNPFKGTSPNYVDAAAIVSSAPDGNYSDLICRPFKDVRDAARRFIKRLDFVRGDRVVLVTFDSVATAIVPYGQAGTPTIPMMTDKPTAIRTLNMQVGVEKNPVPMQFPRCQSAPALGSEIPAQYYGGVNTLGVTSYWVEAQCPDTNMGGGIQQATAMLTNAAWIRREAVWVMILLSDGYPNRTPPITTPNASTGIGAEPRDWLVLTEPDRPGVTETEFQSIPDTDTNYVKYCTVGSPDYGTRPEWCAIGPKSGSPSPKWGLQQGSFGFCPWWTFCDMFSNTSDSSWHPDGTIYPVLPQCIENNPKGIWETSAQIPNENLVPACSDTDPNSRHFCMDDQGRINPAAADLPAGSKYYCDPHYDADDYARDRADFAGLINYIDHSGSSGAPKKGNFIAMYSIFFRNANQDGTLKPLRDNILGVKMLRYMADAGDNGFIDNHLQKWYRDTRDRGWPTNPALGGVANPPTGLNESAVQLPTGWPSPPTGPSPKSKAVTGGGNASQATPPTYDGKDPVWTAAPYNYPPDEDPCAEFDWIERGVSPVLNPPPTTAWTPDSYEWLAAQDCGQYFFADSPNKVDKAFQEIASRLFTRLSR